MLLQNNLRYISLAEKFQKYRPFRVRNQSNMDYPLQTQKAGLLQIPPPIVSQIPQVGGRGYIGFRFTKRLCMDFISQILSTCFWPRKSNKIIDTSTTRKSNKIWTKIYDIWTNIFDIWTEKDEILIEILKFWTKSGIYYRAFYLNFSRLWWACCICYLLFKILRCSEPVIW